MNYNIIHLYGDIWKAVGYNAHIDDPHYSNEIQVVSKLETIASERILLVKMPRDPSECKANMA